MIKYCLKCEECQNIFDSWFSSSKEFDKLKRLNLLSCNICNSTKIKKSLMSPKVLNNKSNSDRPLTFNDFEYQIVSSRTIGLEKGYIVYDFGLGERVVSDEFDVANAVRTGFVNVSN